MTTLSERDRLMLDLERRPWRHGAVKADAIRGELDMSEIRYNQALNALIERPEAWEHDAVTVGRLRRLRDARSERRSSRRG